MTFWDFANQHPWLAAAYALGFWLLGVIVAATLERKPKPGFKSLDRRIRAFEPCDSSVSPEKLHLWVPSKEPLVLECKYCGVTRRK